MTSSCCIGINYRKREANAKCGGTIRPASYLSGWACAAMSGGTMAEGLRVAAGRLQSRRIDIPTGRTYASHDEPPHL